MFDSSHFKRSFFGGLATDKIRFKFFSVLYN